MVALAEPWTGFLGSEEAKSGKEAQTSIDNRRVWR